MYAGWNNYEDFVGLDRRQGTFSHEPTKNMWGFLEIKIQPTVKGDMKFLPFHSNIADLIIFDPPHVSSSKKQSWLARAYGVWTDKERAETLKVVDEEFNRVLQNSGFLLVKILSEQLSLYKTLLHNFVFFLPIYTFRRRGMFDKKKNRGAVWMLGRKKSKERLPLN